MQFEGQSLILDNSSAGNLMKTVTNNCFKPQIQTNDFVNIMKVTYNYYYYCCHTNTNNNIW